MVGGTSPAGDLAYVDVEIVRWPGTRMLAVPGSTPDFEGRVVERDGVRVRLVPLSHAAARRVREFVPWARPTPFGPHGRSFGFGDRLGLAAPGHILALRRVGGSLRPVLAQQSARELERTGRTFDAVLDAATWAVLDAGWKNGFGADADHLKTSLDVADAIAAGFTMVTLDASEHIDMAAAQSTAAGFERRVRNLPWQALEDDWAAMRRRHAALVTDDVRALARTAATYGPALAHVAALVRGVSAEALRELDVEVSLDEVALPTSALDHAFVVTELRRLGVPFTGLAPRFEGRWEKAVDVAGDLDGVQRSIDDHAAVAERFGPYRLSVHSGSDKPTVYPMLAAAGGTWHVKSSGTSYLEALRVVARHAPDLMRRVVTASATNLQRDRATYAIAAGATLPDPRDVVDAELPALLDRADARQCLHVTYGAVLGDPQLARRLLTTLEALANEYAAALEAHFAWHLDPLADLGVTENVFSVAGRVVVVTGGTGAIGGAVARSLAEGDASVVVIARRVDTLPSIDQLGVGGAVAGVGADVLDHEALVSARDSIVARTGRIDALVNCAGGNVTAATVPDGASPFDVPIDALRAVLDLNLVGTVLPTQIFGPAIADAGGGSIVNVSSVGAGRALTRVGGYGAAKAAIESYTRWLAVELGRRGVPIRVNAIMPGFLLGEQNRSLLLAEDGRLTERGTRIVARTPIGRLGAPDDLTATVLWLLSDGARFVTGVVVPVDGGFSAAAGV